LTSGHKKSLFFEEGPTGQWDLLLGYESKRSRPLFEKQAWFTHRPDCLLRRFVTPTVHDYKSAPDFSTTIFDLSQASAASDIAEAGVSAL